MDDLIKHFSTVDFKTIEIELIFLFLGLLIGIFSNMITKIVCPKQKKPKKAKIGS
jgi:hypothetical protein